MDIDSGDRKERIIKEYETVKESGRADMGSARSVQRVAHDMGLYMLTAFLGNDPEAQYEKLLDEIN